MRSNRIISFCNLRIKLRDVGLCHAHLTTPNLMNPELLTVNLPNVVKLNSEPNLYNIEGKLFIRGFQESDTSPRDILGTISDFGNLEWALKTEVWQADSLNVTFSMALPFTTCLAVVSYLEDLRRTEKESVLYGEITISVKRG